MTSHDVGQRVMIQTLLQIQCEWFDRSQVIYYTVSQYILPRWRHVACYVHSRCHPFTQLHVHTSTRLHHIAESTSGNPNTVRSAYALLRHGSTIRRDTLTVAIARDVHSFVRNDIVVTSRLTTVARSDVISGIKLYYRVVIINYDYDIRAVIICTTKQNTFASRKQW